MKLHAVRPVLAPLQDLLDGSGSSCLAGVELSGCRLFMLVRFTVHKTHAEVSSRLCQQYGSMGF